MSLTTAEIQALLRKSGPTTIVRRIPENFDRAAAFLLDLSFEQLFEAAVASEPDSHTFRCKGCYELVKRASRKTHYDAHKREIISNGG